MNRPENTILQYYAAQGSKIGFYYVCKCTRFENEKKYSSSVFKSVCILAYVYTTLFAYILLPTVTLLFVSSNHSEFKSFPVVVDFGVDLQQYYYHLFIPAYISMFMVVNVIASCDATYMIYVQHTCGLLAIVRYDLPLLNKKFHSI